MAIKNDFKSVADSAGNVSNWYFDCIRKNDIVTPEEKLGRYLGVSKERIIAAAKSMVLDSVYVLTGNEKSRKGAVIMEKITNARIKEEYLRIKA